MCWEHIRLNTYFQPITYLPYYRDFPGGATILLSGESHCWNFSLRQTLRRPLPPRYKSVSDSKVTHFQLSFKVLSGLSPKVRYLNKKCGKGEL
jgi:hypothetical protein